MVWFEVNGVEKVSGWGERGLVTRILSAFHCSFLHSLHVSLHTHKKSLNFSCYLPGCGAAGVSLSLSGSDCVRLIWRRDSVVN